VNIDGRVLTADGNILMKMSMVAYRDSFYNEINAIFFWTRIATVNINLMQQKVMGLVFARAYTVVQEMRRL
jgi:hypothetical protein